MEKRIPLSWLVTTLADIHWRRRRPEMAAGVGGIGGAITQLLTRAPADTIAITPPIPLWFD